MSKIGKTPIAIRQGVSVAVSDREIKISGPKGELTFALPADVSVIVEAGFIRITQDNLQSKSARSLYGMARATIANIIQGVDTGFEKKLELSGVGYRASLAGSNLMLSVGFSHPVTFVPPSGIKLSVSENVISVQGIDKSLVGKFAAQIRAVRPPEPYKGKGIRYASERIRRKAGKAAKAVGVK